MLLRRLFFSAFLVGGSLAVSTFTFALTENPFHSFPLPSTSDQQALPISEFSSETASANQSLFDKYGGYNAIKHLVDDTSAALIVDPITAPFLIIAGPSGQETPDKLLSCLDQQFSSLLGGPFRYPGISHFRSAPEEGYACQEMPYSAKSSTEAFDRFMVILSDVLKRNGFESEDIDVIARGFAGLHNPSANDLVGR